MVNYYVQRVGQSILSILTVITLTFLVTKWMPGGPMDYFRATMVDRNPGASQEEINSLVAAYTSVNPSKPLYMQYIEYVTNLLQGDFGQSIWYQKPVAEILGEAMPWTLFLMTLATLTTFIIGVSLGAFMAYKEGSKSDFVLTGIGMFLYSMPYYIAALILVFFLGFRLKVLPTSGAYSNDVTAGFNPAFVKSILMHAFLPYISLLLTQFGGWALSMRGNAISVLGEDYLRVARLRGLPDSRIALSYVGKNAILPLYTGLMIAIGFMFGGSVVLEQIFSYPGLGFFLLQAMKARDDPLMMGGFIVITVAVIVSILIADLTYGKIDPRARSGGGET